MPSDPYEILGVGKSATADEIKRAYRKLAKQYHPDRNPGDKQAEQRFKEVQAAYDVLGDAKRREEFDRFGAGGPTPHYEQWQHAPQPEGAVRFSFSGDDLNGIFEQFFSRASARPRKRGNGARSRGADIEHIVEITLEEVLSGATRELLLTDAEGESERLMVRVPRGVEDGQKIRVRGRGQPGRGGRGDILIVCRLRPHPRFRRVGRDLEIDLPIPFTQAALGGSVEVATLTGAATVKIPAGASSGTRLRLRGQGLPDPRGDERGDLFALIRVTVPKRLSPKAQALLEQLDAALQEDVHASAS